MVRWAWSSSIRTVICGTATTADTNTLTGRRFAGRSRKVDRPQRSIQFGMRGPLYGPEDLQMARDLGFTVLTTTELLASRPRRSAPWSANGPVARHSSRSTSTSLILPARRHRHAGGGRTNGISGPRLSAGLHRHSLGGGDVVEVLPGPGSQQVTAHLAAQVSYEFLSLVARERRTSRLTFALQHG